MNQGNRTSFECFKSAKKKGIFFVKADPFALGTSQCE